MKNKTSIKAKKEPSDKTKALLKLAKEATLKAANNGEEAAFFWEMIWDDEKAAATLREEIRCGNSSKEAVQSAVIVQIADFRECLCRRLRECTDRLEDQICRNLP